MEEKCKLRTINVELLQWNEYHLLKLITKKENYFISLLLLNLYYSFELFFYKRIFGFKIPKMTDLTFRFAESKDVSLILEFIKSLAEYEKMTNDVIATEELLNEWLFTKKAAEVIFAVVNGEEVGFALFFHNFSTFLGRAGLYLEDLFVKPEHRKKGYGKAILKKLAQIAVERGCGRMEWTCLDWNKPSIDFYLSLGAQPMEDWTIYRMAGQKLKDFAE